jgi:hypothetical protein
MLTSLLTPGLILFADNPGDPAPPWTETQMLLMAALTLPLAGMLALLALRRAASVLRRAPRPDCAKTAHIDAAFPRCEPQKRCRAPVSCTAFRIVVCGVIPALALAAGDQQGVAAWKSP